MRQYAISHSIDDMYSMSVPIYNKKPRVIYSALSYLRDIILQTNPYTHKLITHIVSMQVINTLLSIEFIPMKGAEKKKELNYKSPRKLRYDNSTH